MATGLLSFTSVGGGDVWINPAQIRCISGAMAGDEPATAVTFALDHTVLVKGSAASIIEEIREFLFL